MIDKLRKEIKKAADPKKAEVSQRFFKTGRGEYAEGDVFLGITVPESRKIAIKFKDISFTEIVKLLRSKIHEERLIALLVLVNNFNMGDEKMQEKIYKFYLKNIKYINNWDFVDLSADKIVGGYLIRKQKDILFRLAKSKNIWKRRISIIATYYFIKNNKFEETLKISEILLFDNHDLIQKAVGWMLREVGNRDLKMEIGFLNKHYKKMPRTMLRYAIEKFPKKHRMLYLKRN
ncbi:MAG: DNA alkylation repair protein [Candidatus Levybacteria bacterium]|nr:DNA alkylation repair protein [Candidatus Levybacteria bacterium]